MNNITICAKYKGDSTTERGFRTMLFEIPPTGGKKTYTSSNHHLFQALQLKIHVQLADMQRELT